MEDWLFQYAQFAWFKDEFTGAKAASVFLNVFGEEPDNTQTNRSLAPSAPFNSQASTLMDERLEQVTISPGRIDIILAHADRQQSGPWGWKLAEGVRHAERLMEKVSASTARMGELNRVAVIITLIRNLPQASDATKYLVQRSGLDLDAKAIDVQLQVNMQRPGPAGSRMNRLMKFHTASLRDITLGVNAGQPTSPQFGPERHVAALQIDVNLAIDGKTYLPTITPSLVIELFDEARKLALSGSLSGLKDG
ncbi:hypothetical protein [Devosia beringensis]|uniref:hypothetical protein n=1 Tax=Devosia beringensis TaxID=2657486 RepID=UPI00186BA4FC|nr:hypothetical protein [Devosia beringensis]